jgi:HAE1 family hydrophobic/amphiphilic exporter-1
MAISDVSIRNPVFAWMLMVALIVFGAIGFSRMGVSQMPDADFPVLTVSMSLEGAAPEVIETTVIDPLEDALMTVEGLQSITSSSKSGSGSITLSFDLDKNIDVALQEVQTKIAQAQRLLPTGVDPAVITKSNPEDQPIIWLALTYDKNDMAYLNRYARDFVKDQFTTVPGVGEVFLGGYTAPALRVWVKPDALQRYNVAVNDIIDAIKTEHSELPGGSIEEGKKLFNVRTIGEAKSVEEFNAIPINKRAGQQIADPSNSIRMKDVATVEEGLDEVRRIARFNGKPALGMGIRKQRGSNAVAVAKAVKARIAEIQKDLPKGMSLNVNFDSTRFIESSVHELNTHLVLAVILTSLVCWMFLGSWSATANVLLSIPTSIMGAFIGLYFFKFTLNTFTLLGLTLAIGIVVDDAIMVLENIFRYRELGKNKVQAAIVGTREIAFAALAATLAVVAIFLPVAFMKGVIGKYFLQFGVTISLAVLLSLLESLTITPMRAASFVNTAERSSRIGKMFDDFFTKFEKFYLRTLEFSLKRKGLVAVVSVVFMVLSFLLIKFIPKELVPAQDQSLFMVRAQTPVGSSLAYTDEQTKKAEEWLMKQPEVKQVFISVGGFGGGGETNTVMMFVTMVPKEERKLSQEQFMENARKELSKIPDFKPRLQDLSMRGFSSGGRGYPVEFTLQGGDWDKLYKAAQDIMADMEKSGMMTDVDTNYLLGMPEVQVKPDRVQAALSGVSVQGIGSTINSLIGGVKVGQYQKEGKRNDIRLQIVKQRDTVDEVQKLLIGNARGNLIPLSRVVTQKVEPALQQITRVDRQRSISVYANLKPGASQQKAMEYIETRAHQYLPEGYRIQTEGSAQAFKEAFQSLIFALVLGLMVAYMVLAAQFNSFLDPFTILMALPFSISGVFFALLVTFQSLNMYSMIGILLLMGIVKKNSIMLVEFTNHVRERDKLPAHQALLSACPVRLRPIMMTSIATIAAAVPSALATGDGAETTRPMAITIIGGVFVSTILTLYVIPSIYLVLNRFRKTEEMKERVRQAYEELGEATKAH